MRMDKRIKFLELSGPFKGEKRRNTREMKIANNPTMNVS
jgi:hypothetical protein